MESLTGEGGVGGGIWLARLTGWRGYRLADDLMRHGSDSWTMLEQLRTALREEDQTASLIHLHPQTDNISRYQPTSIC